MHRKALMVLVTLNSFVMACGGKGAKSKDTAPKRGAHRVSGGTEEPSPGRNDEADDEASQGVQKNTATRARSKADVTIPPWPKSRRWELMKTLLEQGVRLWKRSCPETPTYGLCLEKGTATTYWSRLEAVPRQTTLQDAALKRLRAVAKLWRRLRRSKGAKDKVKDGVYHVSQALLLLADRRLEEFLRDRMPENLEKRDKATPAGSSSGPRFAPWGRKGKSKGGERGLSKKSLAKLAAWYKKKMKTMKALKSAYTRIIRLLQRHWAMVSLFRIGVAYDAMAWHLAHPEVPKCLKSKAEREHYRKSTARFSGPFKAKAVQAYKMCARFGGKAKAGASAEGGTKQISWTKLCAERGKALQVEKKSAP